MEGRIVTRSIIYILSSIVFFGLTNSLISQDGIQNRLTLDEARTLAYEALSKETKRLPGLTFFTNEDKNLNTRCIDFDILWANPGLGSVHVEFLDVDLLSGEVWGPMMCDHKVNEPLKKLQKSIRVKHGITTEALEEALRQNPCCSPDPGAKPMTTKTPGGK
jgi:hypothetical protein